MKNKPGLLALSALISCLCFSGIYAKEELPFPDLEKTISMDFQDAGLKNILKVFSIQSGLNFIASEAVQDRKISLYLDKVPIREAMDKIFKANNLTYELDEDANIFIVKDWGKPELETLTKIYTLKYRSVPSANLEKEKNSLMAKTGTTTQVSSGVDILTSVKQVLSKEGKITEDIATNSLIITDIPSRFPEIERIIANLDIAQPQVMLEVEILDVSKNVVDKLGFEFGESPFSLILPTSLKEAEIFMGSVANRKASSLVSASAGSVVLGNAYAQALNFLRTETNTKYLARPRLLTLNNETAEISITKDEVVGREDTQTITSGITTTSSVFKRATDLKLTSEGVGIFLRVTPQINLERNEITMVINPKSSVTTQSPLSITQATASQGVNLQSDTEVRTTKSIVKVKDGETVVLGGLFHTDKQVTTKKLPVLGDIPLLGALFRHKNQTRDIERELLVFITPHIIKEIKVEPRRLKKILLPEREQSAIVPRTDHQLAINNSLDDFDNKKR